jgi:hypothetical protein
MGGKSRSSNRTTNNVTNYSLQGMESAETVVAGNGNTVTTTDHGAVNSAFELGDNALEFGGEVVNANSDLAKLAVSSNSSLASNALEQGFDFGALAMESNKETMSKGFEFAESLVQQNTANSAATNLTMKELAKTAATGGASDITDLTQKTVYTFGAVIAIVLLGFVLMMGKK